MTGTLSGSTEPSTHPPQLDACSPLRTLLRAVASGPHPGRQGSTHLHESRPQRRQERPGKGQLGPGTEHQEQETALDPDRVAEPTAPCPCPCPVDPFMGRNPVGVWPGV